jgi:DNA-binding transcriptional MerR regulator
MTPRLFKAADVCEMTQLQPFVLRSWEKEFPGIGVQKSPEGPRFYRPSDLAQVRRIKALVFGEGLTLAGARRRLEETSATGPASDAEVAEVLDALASDARTRIASVRDGLRSILRVLSSAPGTVVVVDDDFKLAPMPAVAERAAKSSAKNGSSKSRTATARSKPHVVSKPVPQGKTKAKAKRGRASA